MLYFGRFVQTSNVVNLRLWFVTVRNRCRLAGIWALVCVLIPWNSLAQSGLPQFTDSTKQSGIRFEHISPSTKERHTHLVMGSGIGWVDYDRDDLPDLYVAQGTPFGTNRVEQERIEVRSIGSDRLYRNLGNGRFEDISEVSGLDAVDYSMGVAVGDFDNDGFSDIYVTNFGRNRLLRNNGDGTFNEIAAVSAVDDSSFGSSCTWVDLDDDGNLDLFVVNYLKLDQNNYKLCKSNDMGRQYSIVCHPRSVPASRDVVFHNEGDGNFTNWTDRLGLTHSSPAQGLGVIATDFDGDGDIDVYVANDSVANDMWINQGNGRLENQALFSGTAFNRKGQREAGMGVVAGDVDGDGLPDLFVTNYYAETNTLYRNEGDGLFLDVTGELGLAAPSRLRLGFGTSLFDFDNDGWLDLFVVNGHVHEGLKMRGRDEPFAQRPQMFHNQFGQRFEDISERVGPYFQRAVVGRSCAVADYDRDGWQDLAVLNLNSRLVLLHNDPPDSDASSLRIELIGTRCNRDAMGAVVDVHTGEKRLTRIRTGASGYLSCNEGCLTIGLGGSKTSVEVTVRWPGGKRETWKSLQPDRQHILIEGRRKTD